MKRSFLISILAMVFIQAKSQQNLRPAYLATVPANFKNCGVLYTYDSVSVDKNKFLLVVDMQDKGLIRLEGKQVKLLLKESKTEGAINTSTYNGGGYTVVIAVTTVSSNAKFDTEKGTIKISKGTKTLTLQVQGRSACDPTTQEGNS